MSLLNKLEAIKKRWDEIARELMEPDIVNDMKKYTRQNKEYSELSEIVEIYNEYTNLLSNINTNKVIIDNFT